MSLFKKKGPEIIDLTDLQKRGILKPSPQQQEDGFVDLSQQSTPPKTAPASSTNPFSFLDTLASSASSSTPTNPQQSINPTPALAVESPPPTHPNRNSPEAQIANLNIKFEDLEYKLNNLIDRLVALESKLNN